MNYNTQNAKIASITEKTLIVGIDVGSETHYARAFNWRNYEYSKKPFAFSNDEAGFAAFKEWMDDIAEKLEMEVIIPGMEPTGHYWLNLGAYLQEQGILFCPGKAANAGGVSVSQLEMAQNAGMVHWTFEEVDGRLKGIMKNIYTRASETAKEYGEPDNLLMGANVSAFREVADAMIAQGDY